ncbi:MAG: A/G-specific adenine glycosylase [Flavobacteriaceae bacterium]|nr:A/G-specific adenine glycosylase [Flavobacteriaceae bacterium]
MNFIIYLLNWYEKNQRKFPWRNTRNPYQIWVSEIIFQQTRINQGYEYFLNFIDKFPDIQTLAAASEDEVLHVWQGLGYYSRAHNLHFSAKFVCSELHGNFPDSYEKILQLKGIGGYTAAAIASIAFGERVPAIDGNAFRVYSRIFNSERDISKTRTFNYFFHLMKPLMPENAGDFNQAVMDLGAMICLPTNPKCEICPIQTECIAFCAKNQQNLPVKSSNLVIKTVSLHYVFVTDSQNFLAKKRSQSGIWKGLYEFPEMNDDFRQKKNVEIRNLTHKLTHRILDITISKIEVKSRQLQHFALAENCLIIPVNERKNYAFPKPLENFLIVI